MSPNGDGSPRDPSAVSAPQAPTRVRSRNVHVVVGLAIAAVVLTILWVFFTLGFCQEGRSFACHLHLVALAALAAAAGVLFGASRFGRELPARRVSRKRPAIADESSDPGPDSASGATSLAAEPGAPSLTLVIAVSVLIVGWLVLVVLGPFDTF